MVMKHNTYRWMVLLWVLIHSTLTFAYDVEVNGIYYNLDTSAKTAEVTSGTNKYTGDVKIPASIYSNGTTFNVTSIGSKAFNFCYSLTSITIPNSVTSIGEDAFRNCFKITSLSLPSSITSIGEGSFSECSGLTSVTIGNGVANISKSLFSSCSSLKSVTIPNNVKTIDDYAFEHCSALTSILIPNSVTSLGIYAFSGCSNLTSVSIGNSVTKIGGNAFSNCTGLTSITIPNSVTSMGSGAFKGCTGLTSITIPNSVTSIGSYTFQNCYSLNTITIPNNVKSISYYAFAACSGLTSVTIPNSVKYMESCAFAECSNINYVKSEIISPFSISTNVFQGISTNATLQVPKGTKSKYEAVSGWTDIFKEIIEENGNNTTSYDITQYITATNIGGAYTRTNNLINSGSQLNWRFSNNSSYSVTLKSMQLIEGSTGAQGNLMSVNQAVDAGTSVSYTTTIGGSGINLPITCRFRYDYNGSEYSTDAVFSGSQSIKYTLSIKSTGNGTTSYGGKSIRNGTESFSVNMLGSATISFSPDTGYKIKTVKVGGSDVTSNVSNNKYTISNITSNTSVEVEYVANTVTTYSLSITASGNGSATYNSTSIRNNTQSFTVSEGMSATVSFTPDNGYRIASVKVNNTDVTSSVSNNKYTISNITANTTLAVTFEAIPVTTYSLTISSSGSGSTSYNGTVIRGGTQSFTVNSGASATVTFSPDSGYKIASVKVNNTDVTSSVSNNQYTISNITANTTLAVTYQATSSSYYSLSITASGNGKASIGTSITRNGTTLYSFKEGSPIVVTFTPDSGNRLAKVTMNDVDVTSKIVNNQFTINAMYLNVTLVATFEEIPVTTYSLSITASGNGYVTYNNTSIRSEARSFTVNEGTSATVLFIPDSGYRIASVKVNNTNVTSSISNNKYTISNITVNTTLSVTFEAIPATTYMLSITASGNGSAMYNSTTVKNQTKSFTLNEGTSATISFTPDSGYRIASVKLNNTDITSSVSNNKYTISNITANTTLAVTFEAIPPTTYTLSITASGNGSATYNSTTIKSKTQSFDVDEGTSATVTFSPDSGYRIASVKVNNTDVTSSVTNNKYTISNIKANTTMEVVFGEEVNTVTINNITYNLNHNEKTAEVTSGTNKYSGKVIIPTSINCNGTTYNVTSIGRSAFCECSGLTSITIPNSLISIGNFAFKYCDGLTSIDIPNGVTSIGEGAFQSCSGLTAVIIGNGVISIEVGAFYECSDLISVTIGNSVKSIRELAFYGCSSLTTVHISDLAVWCNISFYDSYSNPLYYAHHLFLNGTEVKDLEVPNSVTKIGNYAFSYCSSLNSVTIPNNIKTIGSYAFYGCSGLTSAFFTNSVTSIGGYAFYGCSSLASITIPVSVTSIGNSAFQHCSNMNLVKSEIMSPFSIAENVFDRISSGATLQIPKGTKSKYQEFIGWTLNFKNIIEEEGTTTYTLSITASGNGSASYNSTTIKNKTQSFTVNEGTSAIVTFSPDSGYQIANVKVNNTDVTSSVTNNKYTISNITANTTIVVAFEEEVTALTVEGVNYSVVSQTEKTVKVATGNYGQVLTVPATVTQNGKTWTVTGISNDALKDSEELAAVIWNPSAAFTATVSNPNLLLYVKAEEYAPAAVKNVVVNGTANSITLTEAASGNNFYCPQAFTARSISYTHRYGMTTGIGESRGWETLALPFDVQNITHETKGDITPFANRKIGDAKKPFWLYELTGNGFVEAASIKAYTPYIISMPNNPQYDSQWLLNGNVTFAASNVTVGKTEDVNTATYRDRTFVPNFVAKGAADGLYALNVNNDYTTNESGMTEGSKFVLNMRTVHPFEAYMTTASNARQVIDVFEDMTTDIRMLGIWEQCGGGDDAVYDLQGRQVSHMTKGVYVGKKGQKYIIK